MVSPWSAGWKPVWSAILNDALAVSGNLTISTGFRNTCLDFFSPETFSYIRFLCNAPLPAPTHCPLFFEHTTHRFFSACLRVKDCVSPSLYTCHLLNLMTQILRIHLTMMTMTMTTRTRLRRTSQTGHQWVHLSAHCLQSLLSPLFLSVNGAKHIRAKVKVSMRPKCPILLELIGW